MLLFGPQLSVCLGEVSASGRLKMWCLYVAGTTTECLLRRGVPLWEGDKKCSVFMWLGPHLSVW